MNRLQQLGITPIVGLVHHGSGPAYTSLVDPRFPELLANYARAVAERYPWVNAYTPVNEPLTTARFSGLYGHWYPHGRDRFTFAQTLLRQMQGVVLAMRAIREVNPAAYLVQTEDLGETSSTPRLAYQADFENERRWLSYDLLTGRLERNGVMWRDLRESGWSQTELAAFNAEPCPPAVIGINHYVTSSRFLDENVDRYPEHMHGGNGRDAYVDLETVRARAEGLTEPQRILRDAHERYRLPIAVTEAHLGCTREEQLRWFAEIWTAATALRKEQVPVVAVTAWTLFGAYDWNSLLTREDGHYEPGAYDLRSPGGRPTALAQLLRNVATTGECLHPVLGTAGWWRRDVRLLAPAAPGRADTLNIVRKVYVPRVLRPADGGGEMTRMVLIAGATGALGQAFARLCYLRGLPFRLLSRSEMDIADPDSVQTALRAFRPWAVVNAAGFFRRGRGGNSAGAVLPRETRMAPRIWPGNARASGLAC
jgi:dTDP-4-dehydrorhamnose reductase